MEQGQHLLALTTLGDLIDSNEIKDDTIDFGDIADSLTLDASTTITNALTGNLVLNLSSTGDFIIQDNGTAFATFSDSGVLTIAHGGLRLTDKGSTGDPSTCTAGDLYFNSTDTTVKACTASNTWEGLDGGGLGYTLQVSTLSNGNPADSTTYYLANAQSMQNNTSAATNAARFYIPKAGTITAVYGVATVAGTLGTSESSTLAVRLNDTTSTTVTSSLAMSSAANTFSNSSLSIAVVAGDYISITLATPAWVTNPTTTGITLSIYIE